MAHEINEANGKRSFVSRNIPAWHRLGEVVTNYTEIDTWEKMCEKAGANWELLRIPFYNPFTDEETGFDGLYRSDNHVCIATCGKDYEVIQNAEVFKTLDALVGDNFHYETAGVLGKGERIFVTASIGNCNILSSGDRHVTYLLACTSHDGSMSNIYKVVKERVVCANTLAMALGEKGKSAKVYHTKGANERLQDVRKMVESAHKIDNQITEKLEVLAQRKVNQEIVEEALAQCFGITSQKEQDEISDAKAKAIGTVCNLFESNDGNTFPEFRGTGYNLVNALTEYSDHYKGARSDYNRAKNSIFDNETVKFKNQAVEVVMELTNGQTVLVNQPVAYSIPSYVEKHIPTDGLLDEILSDYE